MGWAGCAPIHLVPGVFYEPPNLFAPLIFGDLVLVGAYKGNRDHVHCFAKVGLVPIYIGDLIEGLLFVGAHRAILILETKPRASDVMIIVSSTKEHKQQKQ